MAGDRFIFRIHFKWECFEYLVLTSFSVYFFTNIHHVNELFIKLEMKGNAQEEFLAKNRICFANRIPYMIIVMVGISANLEGMVI